MWRPALWASIWWPPLGSGCACMRLWRGHRPEAPGGWRQGVAEPRR
jgi:hypothetical protein